MFVTKGMDDMSIKYLVEGGVLGVRRVEKTDMKRLAKVTGAKIQLTLANLEGEESFSEDSLGKADVVEESRVGDNDFIFVYGCEEAKASTLLLRGSTEYMLEETERSVHDALMAVSKTAESSSVVPGRMDFIEEQSGPVSPNILSHGVVILIISPNVLPSPPGGGACETALSLHLEDYGRTLAVTA